MAMTTLRSTDATPRTPAAVPSAPGVANPAAIAPTPATRMQADRYQAAAPKAPANVAGSVFAPGAESGSPRDQLSTYGAYATIGGCVSMLGGVGAWAVLGVASPLVTPLLAASGALLVGAGVLAALAYTVSSKVKGSDKSTASRLQNIAIYAGIGATAALGTTLFATIGTVLAVATLWGGVALLGAAAASGVASYVYSAK
jgi:hypothetical protein